MRVCIVLILFQWVDVAYPNTKVSSQIGIMLALSVVIAFLQDVKELIR